MDKVYCKNCRHFRSAPWEAKHEGCYHPELMQAKQKDAFLDEQQMPGDHERINRNGDCKDFAARKKPLAFFQRLFSLGA